MTERPVKRQSYWRRILGQALMRGGARLGLLWVGILAVTGVFAPFLASSFPLLLSQGGEVSSPVLEHLKPVDVLFLVAFVAVFALFFSRVTFGRKLLVMAGLLAVSAVAAYAWVSPPKLVIYEQYRVAEAQGRYDWVLYAPVPYSPKDYLRDRGETGLEAPLANGERTHWFGTEQNGADV
ncbi:MAG: ABC transporter permease, partial [Candidatus Thiodiazotropha sp.]